MASSLETTPTPWVRAMSNEASAEFLAATNPMRLQRAVQSDRNPLMQPVAALRVGHDEAVRGGERRHLHRYHAERTEKNNAQYQKPASPEQLKAFEDSKPLHAQISGHDRG